MVQTPSLYVIPRTGVKRKPVADLDSLTDPENVTGAATTLWLQLMGVPLTVLCNVITFVAIECSNCANLTSAARMVCVHMCVCVCSAVDA